MHWFVATLTLLVTLAGFANFVIGDGGNATVKDRLIDFYVAVDGDWRLLYQSPARHVSSFLMKIFGRRWWIYVLRVVLCSVVYVTIICTLTTLQVAPSPGHLGEYVPDFDWEVAENFFIGNIIGDVISWTTARFIFLRISRANLVYGVFLLAVAIIVSYISLTIAQFVPEIMNMERGWLDTPNIAYHNPTIHVVPYVTLLPLAIFMIVSVFGLIAVAFRPILQRPLMLLLERIVDAPQSALSLVALAIAALIGIISSFSK